jgi:Peptidase family S41
MFGSFRVLWFAVLFAAILGAQSPTVNGGNLNEPPAPLTPQGLDNLRALARLLGFIRYFHPADEAAGIDWNRFTMVAVRAVEPARTPEELAARLRSIFAPVAPLVRIFPANSVPPIETKSAPEVIMWQHHGLGLPQRFPSAYWSKRIVMPVSEAGDALRPFRADLPGGVACVVPIALYRVVSVPPAEALVASTPRGSSNDRATRLAAIIIAWNIFQHFYPYFDVVHADWIGTLGALLSEAAQDKDAHAFAITLQKMTVILRDGHGYVDGPAMLPNYVPPVLWTIADGRIVALSVHAAVDVKPGDAIVTIDGQPAAEVLATKKAVVPGVTPQCIRERALDQLLVRRPGDRVRLELEPAAQPDSRRTVMLESTTRIGDLRPSRPPAFTELEPGIFYLDITRTNDSDFAAALPFLAEAHSVIFDMRDRPSKIMQFSQFLGHLINEPVKGPPMGIPVVTRPDRAGMTFEWSQWQIPPQAPYLKAKRAFLTSGRAISYAETMLAIVEHFKLGEIIGEATAGTNGEVNPFTVPGGYQLNWTGMRVLKHDRSPLFGVGILPTIRVSPTWAGIAAGRDEVLERALGAVRQ